MGEKVYVEEVPDVPAGDFYAKIVKYEPYTGKFDPAFRVFFMIAQKGKAVGPINGIFPKRATPANKTGKLLMATIGECTVDRVYDMDALVDKCCWVNVVRIVTDDGPISRVKRVLWPPPNAAAIKEGKWVPAEEPATDWEKSADSSEVDDMPF